MKKWYVILFYSVVSGILLSLPWLNHSSGFFLFISFVPLLFIEDYFYNRRTEYRPVKVFFSSLTAFFLWNIITTYWIYNATWFGAAAAILVNATIYALLFYGFHVTRRKLGNIAGYISLIILWVAFEFVYLNGEMSWPWLNLGNGLANDIKIIQWYEYTGTMGGTVWVLVINILIFRLISLWKNRETKQNYYFITALLLFFLIPIIASVLRYYTYVEKSNPFNIVVVQPNIDPYGEKFDGSMSGNEQLGVMLHLADSAAQNDSTVDYFVGPETAIVDYVFENQIDSCTSIKLITNFLGKYPRASFVIGGNGYHDFEPGEQVTPTARKYRRDVGFYDSYNSAYQVDTSRKTQIYHKSKLVVGVEKMPYPQYMKFINSFAINLGGTVGSLGTQKERAVFANRFKRNNVAPSVCYESIYGDYMGGYIKKGADMIFVITNDGWWGNTPGHMQHHSYSRLRAIELRRSVARSANTGISSFIDQRGDVFQMTNWWVPIAIKGTINGNDEITFYAKHGDYIGRVCGMLALILLIYINIIDRLRRRFIKK